MSEGAGDIGMSREALAFANDRLVEAVLAQGGFPTKVTLSDGRWAWAAPDRRAWRPDRVVREADINLRQSWPMPENAEAAAKARATAPAPAWGERRPPKVAPPPRPAAVPPKAVAPSKPIQPPAGDRVPHAVRLASAIGQLGRAAAPELSRLLGWTVEEVRGHLVKMGVAGQLVGAGRNAAGERLWRLAGKAA